MENTIAGIIAYSTAAITVALCVGLGTWWGIKANRREKQYPRKIDYLDDGFVYHDFLEDTQVRWSDIEKVEAKIETHNTSTGKYSRGKTTNNLVIHIKTTQTSFSIFPEDFENVNFNEFVSTLEQRVHSTNPQFMGIDGDTERFRRALKAQQPKVDASVEAEEKEFDRRFEMRTAALGHPVTTKERIAIVKELQREMKKERLKNGRRNQ
ncbi:MAG: hypothetical protein H6Q49_1966 [Deltaproteobacteria bacterium]|nr:hypothetical protein [Deltaproteobacteria bacterium]